MNVKKIVLKAGEELPECCWECDACQGIGPDYLYCFGKHIDIDAYSTRPSWCPLVVDECCEWKLEDNVGAKSACNVITRHPDNFQDGMYCWNCGKRIKYVESEE